jgi:hypothetical protein
MNFFVFVRRFVAIISGKGRKKGQKKDPNAPKNPSNAYIFFRSEFCAEHKGEFDVRELNKRTGERWKTMGVEERSKYVEMSNEDSARYKEQMEAYKGASYANFC